MTRPRVDGRTVSVRLLVNELVTNAFKHGYSDIGGAVSVIARNHCGDIPSRIGQWQGPAAGIFIRRERRKKPGDEGGARACAAAGGRSFRSKVVDRAGVLSSIAERCI